MEVMGGHDCKRSDLPIGLAKQDIEGLNIYGEPIGQMTVGISIGKVTYRSKSRIWKIETRFEKKFSYTYTETSLDTESRNDNVTLRNVTGNNPVTETHNTRKSHTGISRTENNPAKDSTQDLYIDDLYIDRDLDSDLEPTRSIGSGTGPDRFRAHKKNILNQEVCDPGNSEERAGTSSSPLEFCQ